jgi:excisionase family DNA binding protein
MTVNDVAFALSISRDSVYRLVRAGDLRGRRVGQRLRFRPAEIEAYVERDRVP